MEKLKIGERVTIECVSTILSKPLICTKCVLHQMLPHCSKYCSAANRRDKANVFFKEVKE